MKNQYIIKNGPPIEEMQKALFQPPSAGQGQPNLLTFGITTDPVQGATIKATLTGCEAEDETRRKWNIKGMVIASDKSQKPYKGYYDIGQQTGHISTID